MNVLLFGHQMAGAHSGETVIADSTANHYTLGRRPIADTYRLGVFNLPIDTVIARIQLCRLKDRRAAARGLMLLLESGAVSISKERENQIQEWYRSENEITFLAKTLVCSMECEYTCEKPLDKQAVAVLAEYRKRATEERAADAQPPKTEKTGPDKAGPEQMESEQKLSDYDPSGPLQDIAAQHKAMDTFFQPAAQPEPHIYPYDAIIPGHENVVGAYYEVRRLDYSEEYKRLDQYFEEFEPFDSDMKIPKKTITNFRYVFCRAAATFEMKVIGYPSGIADAILSRVQRGSCWQLSFIVKLEQRTPLSALRILLKNIINYALAEDGRVLFSYAQADNVPINQYAITCIYSLKEFSENDQFRQETVFEKTNLLSPQDLCKNEWIIPPFLGLNTDQPDGFDQQQQRWLRKPKTKLPPQFT